MCFNTAIQQPLESVKRRWPNIIIKDGELVQGELFNGFTFPETSIIAGDTPNNLTRAHWGLLPSWTQDKSFRKNTLNARIETIHEKASFRTSVNNRCLILADSFFEWQWKDEKGKQKQKYQLHLPDFEPFGLAGIYNDWTDKSTGEIVRTYSILTCEANELMARIHNTKKRMPVMPSPELEMDWLLGGELLMQNDKLIAEAV